MQVQVHTDHSINGDEAMVTQIGAVVETALNGISEHVSRVDVHLSDENGGKGGPNDKRCVMESRLVGHQPVAVTDHAQTVEQAVSGAAGKLARLLESTIERQRDLAKSRS